MYIKFQLNWEYDEDSGIDKYTIKYDKTPKICVNLEINEWDNEVLVDVEKPMLLENFESMVQSVWRNNIDFSHKLINNRDLLIKSHKDEDNYPKDTIVYTTTHCVKLTERSINNLSDGYLMTSGKLFNRYKEKKKVKHNPIKEYTKKPDKVYAVQYKIHNKKEIEDFVDKSYTDNGMLFVISSTTEFIVDYGDFVVKEDDNIMVYKEEVFKSKYH